MMSSDSFFQVLTIIDKQHIVDVSPAEKRVQRKRLLSLVERVRSGLDHSVCRENLRTADSRRKALKREAGEWALAV